MSERQTLYVAGLDRTAKTEEVQDGAPAAALRLARA
jgi:hypothetical protein